MSETRRRILLYTLGVLAVGGLLVAGFLYRPGPDAGTRLSSASMLASLGHFDQALVECDAVLREDPNSLPARVYRATFLAMAQRHEEALRAFDDAIECAPSDDEEIRLDLAVDRAGVLASAGRWDEFEQVRKSLIATSRRRADLLTGLAAFKREQWNEASDAYRRALKADKDNASLKSQLWSSLVRGGDKSVETGAFDKAKRAYFEASRLFEEPNDGHRKLAEVYLALGEPAAAAAIVKEVGPKLPGCATLVFRIATTWLEQGKRDEALEALNGALDVNEETVRVLLSKDPAWDDVRNDTDVQEILDMGQPNRESN